MAEKIIDIKLNSKEATKEIESLDKSIQQLEDNVSEANRELNKMEKELSKVTGASGKDLARRQQLNEKIAKTKAFIKQENFALKQNNKQKTRAKKTNADLNKKLKEQAKAHNEVSKGLTKTIGGTSVLDQATGGLFSSFTGLTQGLRAATTGMKFFKVALISTGVGALVVALGALFAAFTSSEEGQNKLTKGLNIAKAVMANVVSVLTSLGNKLIDIGKSMTKVFNNPKKALTDFAKLFKENIQERFESYLDTLGLMASAIKKVFSGDFVGAMEDAKSAAKESIDVITGIDGAYDKAGKAIEDTVKTVKEKVSEFSKDIKEDIKTAKDLSDMVAKADRIDRELLVQRQKDNIKINDLRTKAYNTEKFNNEERIAFLREAIKIEDDITSKEIEAADLRFKAKSLENTMVAEVRKQDLDDQAKFEAKVFQLQSVKINRQREVSNQEQMILRKDSAEKEKIKKDADDKEIERIQSLQEILDEIKTTKENEEAETEIQKNDLEEERKLAELESLSATEEQKQIIREFYAGKRRQLEEKNDQEQIKRDKIVANAKMNMAKQTLMNISNVLGKSSAAGKASAVAASLINTYQGITAELATKTVTPFEFGIKLANIATTSAIGFKSVKDILSTNTKTTSGSPSGGGGGRQITAPPTPPSINVVGAAPENQLAAAIGEQQDKPVQAFVVGSEVTSQQALDRNIVDNASLG